MVTGATDGIGRAVSERLIAEGAAVLMVARGAERGEALAAELGERAHFLAGDVGEPATAGRAVALAVERFGALDVLVNNAGIDHTAALESAPLGPVRQVFDVNFFGALQLMQAAAAVMLDRGGAIVNLTSRLASIGVPTMSLYAASKGALLALTRGAAVEWAGRGVRVNAVAPGLTETPLAREWIAAMEDPEAWRREVEATIPQGRLGSAEEVAAAVAYLASEEAGHVTGASLAIDGGYTAA
ncbi:MAG: SDR family oxidoreductase [Actinobacteria bacterium]|nr:SDR family oxidoreductase [Actinomycetota bacterium]